MNESSKPSGIGGYIVAGAIVGALVGYGVYTWRESLVVSSHAGWELVDRAPWCAVDNVNHKLMCRYFSEKHCDIGAIIDAVKGPVGPLCVPKPK